MLKKLRDNKGVSVIVWILLVAIVVMGILIAFPNILDFGKAGAEAMDKSHEESCMESVRLDGIADRAYDGVYDYTGKKFVGLNEHPSQVEPYGNTKEHEDCVILVHSNGTGEDGVTLSWMSRTTLKERYQ